ncbi:hypothetical protein ACJJTC_006830 [Scirpophaga incertulas]
MGVQSVTVSILSLLLLQCASSDVLWRWACNDGKCQKERSNPHSTEPALSLQACKMFCNEYGLLWPKPTGDVDLGNFLSKVNLNNINVKLFNRGKSDDLMNAAAQRFKDMVGMSIPKGVALKLTGKSLDVHIVNTNPELREFSLDIDEGYDLSIAPKNPDVKLASDLNATIIAKSFFGLRNGLETLAQLFIYDEIRDHLLIVRDVKITDKPVYPYRGLLLDTARNYYTVESIKNTIDAMASVKLNTFHWHITDSQSFPFESKRRPQLTKLGTLTPQKVYTKEIITDIVNYGLERGVRVLPEFDAPAHVGEGWQDTDLTVCFKAEPWRNYCVEPPCGQLNPTKDELYDYLEDIYTDMAEVFITTDMFHMGGDEVSERCWNSSESIQNFMVQNRWDLDSGSFLKLWNYFQKKAEERAYKAFGRKLPLILWTSTLTNFNHIQNYLKKEDYFIQVWTTGQDPQIKGLLEKGYKLIISNYDALYLDCGFGAWIGAGRIISFIFLAITGVLLILVGKKYMIIALQLWPQNIRIKYWAERRLYGQNSRTRRRLTVAYGLARLLWLNDFGPSLPPLGSTRNKGCCISERDWFAWVYKPTPSNLNGAIKTKARVISNLRRLLINKKKCN